MPFTDPFDIGNVSTPSGSTTPATQIDDKLRAAKSSLLERMNQILGASQWASDPVIDGVTLKSIATLVTEVGAKAALSGATANRLIKAATATTITQSSLSESAVSAAVNGVNGSTGYDVDTNASGTLSINLAAGIWLISYRGNALSASPCTATISVALAQHAKVHSTGVDFSLVTVVVNAGPGTVQVDFGSSGGTGSYEMLRKKLNLV